MRMLIEFEYHIEYVLARRRNGERALALANVEVEIEETPLESARLVFEAGTSDHEELRRSVVPCIPDGGGERPARFYEIDGRLYREYCRIEDLARLTREADFTSPFHVGPKGNPGLESIVQQGHSGEKRVYFTRESIVEKVMKEHYLDRYDPKPVPESGLFRSYRDDAGQSRTSLIHERASELRLLDGCVVAPASEPVIALAHLGTTEHHTAYAVAEISDGGWSRFGVGGYHALYHGTAEAFALDDIDGAKGYARMMGMELGCLDMTRVLRAPRDELAHDPSYGFRRHAKGFVNELAKSVHAMSPDAVAAFIGLRTAERNSPSWTTRTLVEAVMLMNDALRAPGSVRKPIKERGTTLDTYDPIAAATTRTLTESEWQVGRLLSSRVGRDLKTCSTEPPSVDGKHLAAQVSSDFDRSVILDAMRTIDDLPNVAPGDVLIAVEAVVKGKALSEAQHEGLFLFDRDGNLLHSAGRAGSPPPPSIGDLARSHAVRVMSDATALQDGDGLDENDLAALSME